MNNKNSDILVAIADAYATFLSAFPWGQPLVLAGAKEGLNKFLSNAYLHYFPKCRKYELTQFISPAALEYLNSNKDKKQFGIVFEHIVPKRRFIQEPSERLARQNLLEKDFVLSLLRRYWVLATITKDEDRCLLRTTMPKAWDGVDVFARYKQAGVMLVDNPFVVAGVPIYRPEI